jgi:hypothetical protein
MVETAEPVRIQPSTALATAATEGRGQLKDRVVILLDTERTSSIGGVGDTGAAGRRRRPWFMSS